MRTPRVAVVGSNMIDLTVTIDKMPKAGETLEAPYFEFGFGGKGANQAVAAAKLGADVTMICKLGDDLFGQSVLANFEALGMDTSYVTVAQGTSNGVAPIFVDPKGENRILIVKGANNYLLPKDVEAAQEKLLQCDLILLQLEVPLETVYYTIEFGKKHDIPVILNPAPATNLDFDFVRKVTTLIPNETELELLTGKPVESMEQATLGAQLLLDKGIPVVIVTLGEKGSLLATSEGVQHFPALSVNCKDTTGAGDAFIGSFAMFYVQTGDIGKAIASANAYAGFSTEGMGTQKAFLSKAQFESRLAGGLK